MATKKKGAAPAKAAKAAAPAKPAGKTLAMGTESNSFTSPGEALKAAKDFIDNHDHDKQHFTVEIFSTGDGGIQVVTSTHHAK